MSIDKKEEWEQRIKKDKESLPKRQYCQGYIALLTEVLCKFRIYSESEIAEIVNYLDEKYNWCETIMMIPLENPTKVVEDFLTETIEQFLHQKVRSSIIHSIPNNVAIEPVPKIVAHTEQFNVK